MMEKTKGMQRNMNTSTEKEKYMKTMMKKTNKKNKRNI